MQRSTLISPVLVILGAAFLLCPRIAGAAEPLADKSDVAGFWYTEEKAGGIELYHCGSEICGRFYWIKAKDFGTLDRLNPNPALRKNPICKEQFMGGFKPQGDGHFTGGWIYSPLHGATFDAEMTLLSPDKLKVKGFILLPFFGGSQIWNKVSKLPSCLDG